MSRLSNLKQIGPASIELMRLMRDTGWANQRTLMPRLIQNGLAIHRGGGKFVLTARGLELLEEHEQEQSE